MYTRYKENTMDKLELKALGKLNLGLDILGQMENGGG